MALKVKSSTTLVTGASGLIGAALCQALSKSAKVIPCSRNPMGAGWVKYDATQPIDYDFGVDVIVHAASPASPDLFVSNPVETLMANVYGLQQLLEYARRCGAKKVVYVSSSEVYGNVPPREDGFLETDYGFVDVLNPRSSYPMGKRAAETLCASYVAEYGLDVSIVRPGHIYGPTCSEKDKRVSSAFPWLAARGLPIVMKSDGAQIRSYTHADDCAQAIIKVIECGQPGEAYNIASRCGKCSIRQMAEIVAQAGGVDLRIELPGAAEASAFNPMNNSCLDPSKLEALGWHGEISPKRGFEEAVMALRKKLENKERK